jgi:hypothetical protein
MKKFLLGALTGFVATEVALIALMLHDEEYYEASRKAAKKIFPGLRIL